MAEDNRNTRAIVLDCRDHGESDKIITFFTLDSGRLTGIAKGANRSKKRFLNKLELFTLLTITYSEKKRASLALVLDGDLHDAFIDLRLDIKKYTAATLMREIILLATVEREQDKRIFEILHWGLHSLSEGRPPLAVTTLFLLKTFEQLGYQPDLSGCRRCGQELDMDATYIFHAMAGGLVCKRCINVEEPGSVALSMGTIRLLSSALSTPLDRLHRLQFSEQSLRQSLAVFHSYGRTLFQREIQSWKAVKQLF